ncbi:hypothetical protein [Mangrovibacterium diazotrophicum]|uniref:DUF5808 domain-containing protein n=1 Tax=Mangrovibacterium diazotrophicum TaxID=1261403 RepID=A0A419VUB3_9BACT|nr:hypothetical protein [Mangrovibacterium diazotrophicum]RKD85036.1 hypothetical protein BC643_4555 [Mangrovibacterium diazotrophicum]
MRLEESNFEKSKRESEGKYKLGMFYSNENDDRVVVPDRWGIGNGEINIAHPKFRRFLLFVVIFILAGVLIFEYII